LIAMTRSQSWSGWVDGDMPQRDARAVDEDVEGAERGEDPFQFRRFGDFQLLRPGARRRSGGNPRPLGVAVEDHDSRPCLGKDRRRRPANAARSPVTAARMSSRRNVPCIT
jgi:hypothetical protein